MLSALGHTSSDPPFLSSFPKPREGRTQGHAARGKRAAGDLGVRLTTTRCLWVKLRPREEVLLCPFAHPGLLWKVSSFSLPPSPRSIKCEETEWHTKPLSLFLHHPWRRREQTTNYREEEEEEERSNSSRVRLCPRGEGKLWGVTEADSPLIERGGPGETAVAPETVLLDSALAAGKGRREGGTLHSPCPPGSVGEGSQGTSPGKAANYFCRAGSCALHSSNLKCGGVS